MFFIKVKIKRIFFLYDIFSKSTNISYLVLPRRELTLQSINFHKLVSISKILSISSRDKLKSV